MLRLQPDGIKAPYGASGFNPMRIEVIVVRQIPVARLRGPIVAHQTSVARSRGGIVNRQRPVVRSQGQIADRQAVPASLQGVLEGCKSREK